MTFWRGHAERATNWHQNWAMMADEGAGEEDSSRILGRLWHFQKATLGAQQIGTQRGAMVSGGAAGEGEERSSRADLWWLYGEADAIGAERRTAEPDVVAEDEIGGRTSAVTKRRVQRRAVSVITTMRTISTRQNPVEDETDPEVTFETLSAPTAVVAKPSSRTTVTRGEIAMASGRVTDWAQSLDTGLNTPTSIPTFGRGAFTPTISVRGAMVVSGSGRGIIKLDEPDYIRVRCNELATPGRSGRSSRASVRSVDMVELESRLLQERNEKVGAFEEQLLKIQQDYPQSSDGFQGMQQQDEQVSAGERTELTLQLNEVKMVNI